MENTIKFLVSKDDNGIRLDIFLCQQFDFLSRTKIKKIILSDKILVNNKQESPSFILKGNEEIKYDFSISSSSIDINPENIHLDIIYEDEYLVVINKPPGLVVNPGNGIDNGTLANALLYHFSNLSSINKTSPGIVHRLDKETSGVILVAKDDHTHWKL